MDKDNKETVGMLLDIEHLYGEHEGRLAPVLLTLIIIAAPILLYIYFGIFMFVPLFVFIPIEIVIAIETILIIPGRQAHRVSIYKKQINSDYTNTADWLNVKMVHPDGCIEYINGTICYLVCCFNGTADNEVLRSIQLRKFLESMLGDFIADIYIQNVNDSPALRDYYSKVSEFSRNASATNFVNIIDHNLQLTEDTSMVQCTIYALKGSKSDWKLIKTQIDTAIRSKVARCYKTVYRVSDATVINSILNRDIDSIINMSDLIRRKYSTQNYGSSKVLAYDLPDDTEIIQGLGKADPVVDDKPNKAGFHVKYKE